MDNNPTLVGTYIKGIPVVGSEDLLETEEWKHKVSNVYCPIGNNPLRRKILSRVKELGYNTPYFIHPSACIADNVSIAEGVYVLPQTVIAPFVTLKKYSMVAINASIEHHSILNEGCFVASGVNVGANVNLIKDSYVGMGAVVITGVKIVGENSLIGAGSIVIRDVPDNAVMVGNPAKVLKYKE